MKVIQIIKIPDAEIIADKIQYRMDTFNEDLKWATTMVLLNYGMGWIKVKCIHGEWEGIKKELKPREGVPLCPNGHPLLEYGSIPGLAVVDDVEGLIGG